MTMVGANRGLNDDNQPCLATTKGMQRPSKGKCKGWRRHDLEESSQAFDHSWTTAAFRRTCLHDRKDHPSARSRHGQRWTLAEHRHILMEIL
jgi:hypothetical protein